MRVALLGGGTIARLGAALARDRMEVLAKRPRAVIEAASREHLMPLSDAGISVVVLFSALADARLRSTFWMHG